MYDTCTTTIYKKKKETGIFQIVAMDQCKNRDLFININKLETNRFK